MNVNPQWKTPRRKKRRRPLKDDDWPEARLAALRRAGGRCQAQLKGCEEWANHVHHKLRRSQGGTHDDNNLLVACHKCHAHIHENPTESYERGFLLHSWD